MTSSSHVWLISLAANYLPVVPARYDALYTARTLSDATLTRYLALAIFPRLPFHISVNFSRMFYEFWSVLLVSVGTRHFLSPAVLKEVIFISLDGLEFMFLFKTFRSELIVHDINGIGEEDGKRIRGGFIAFIIENLEGKWTGRGDLMVFG